MPSWNGREYAKRLAYQERGLAVQLIAWMGDRPAGRSMLVFPGHPEWTVSDLRERCPEIRDLAVAEGWQRRGIGSALAEATVDEARAAGFDRVGLTVGQEESYAAAQRMYERLGFVPAHGPFISSTRLEAEDGSWFAVAGVMRYLVKSLTSDQLAPVIE
ncbi:MAG: GNAT family N-acetyltransferase [Actinomycetota bacterium]